MTPDLLRRSMRLGIAVLITAAVAVWSERVTYVWYSLMAVVFVVDDDDEHTLRAAADRVFGTIAGALITFLVHTILSGWMGVLVSFLLMLPLLRWMGWQSATGIATMVSLMFLMIPSHAELNWGYVLGRGLDTALGTVIAIATGLLLWPRDREARLLSLSGALTGQLRAQLLAYEAWLGGSGRRPDPLAPADLSRTWLSALGVLEAQRPGRGAEWLRRGRWRQRLLLWETLQHHWVQWERLVATLPEHWPAAGRADGMALGLAEPREEAGDPLREGVRAMLAALTAEATPYPAGCTAQPTRWPAAAASPRAWQRLAEAGHLPLLPLLAVAEEQRPLLASLRSFTALQRRAGGRGARA